jgi:DNA-binding FadR family transcriptional regulator
VPIQVVESQRLYQQIAEQIGELIRNGEFRAGDRLPAARDLARQLGVSRPVVREAMIALEMAGLVEVRTGSGIYVQGAEVHAKQAFALPDAGPSPFDVIAARKLLEPEITLMAVGNASETDLGRIAETLRQMEEFQRSGRDIKPADRLFHTRIAAATGNTVLASIVNRLWEQTFAPIFNSLHAHTQLPGHERAALAEHADILRALQDRDGPGARDAMRAHLARTEAIMLAGTPSLSDGGD